MVAGTAAAMQGKGWVFLGLARKWRSKHRARSKTSLKDHSRCGADPNISQIDGKEKSTHWSGATKALAARMRRRADFRLRFYKFVEQSCTLSLTPSHTALQTPFLPMKALSLIGYCGFAQSAFRQNACCSLCKQAQRLWQRLRGPLQ